MALPWVVAGQAVVAAAGDRGDLAGGGVLEVAVLGGGDKGVVRVGSAGYGQPAGKRTRLAARAWCP
jgi:hypothetical protein